jgi:hypothetical protein
LHFEDRTEASFAVEVACYIVSKDKSKQIDQLNFRILIMQDNLGKSEVKSIVIQFLSIEIATEIDEIESEPDDFIVKQSAKKCERPGVDLQQQSTLRDFRIELLIVPISE